LTVVEQSLERLVARLKNVVVVDCRLIDYIELLVLGLLVRSGCPCQLGLPCQLIDSFARFFGFLFCLFSQLYVDSGLLALFCCSSCSCGSCVCLISGRRRYFLVHGLILLNVVLGHFDEIQPAFGLVSMKILFGS